MTRGPADLPVEQIAGESDKFRAPLLVLHGLWSSPGAWRRGAGFLAHLGWRCLLPDLAAVWRRGSSPWEASQAAVGRLVASLPAPPVVFGHDAGALLALSLAGRACAVAALAPLVPAAFGGRAERWLAGKARGWWPMRTGAPAPWRSASARPGRVPRALLREILAAEIAPARPAPEGTLLLVAGRDDPVSPVAAVEALARRFSARHAILPGGHDFPLGPHWRASLAFVHRWVIRAVGEPLLELLEADDEGDSPPAL